MNDFRRSLLSVLQGLLPVPCCIRLGTVVNRGLLSLGVGTDRQQRVGLITKLVPAADFIAQIDAMIAPYLDASPAAMQAAKSLIRKLQPAIDDAMIDMTIRALADCWDHPDAREGVDAFFSHRTPSWKLDGTC